MSPNTLATGPVPPPTMARLPRGSLLHRPTFLWMAWRNVQRNRRRTLITMSAIAVGLVLITFVRGLERGTKGDVLYDIVRLQGGHIEIRTQHEEGSRKTLVVFKPRDAEEILAMVRQRPEVEAVAPRLRFGGLAYTSTGSNNVELIGIDPVLEKNVNPLVYEGSPRYLDTEDRDEALVGMALAELLGLQEGERFTVLFRAADGSPAAHRFTVKSRYKAGFAEYEKARVFIPLETAQKLMTRGVTSIAMLVKDPPRAPELAQALERGLAAKNPPLDVPADAVPWQESQATIIEVLGMRDAVIGLLGIIVLTIAAFGILNTMLMSVYERTREIGVMMALGMKGREVVALFLWEGLLIGVLGAFLGLSMGAALTKYLEQVGLSLGDFNVGEIANFPLRSTFFPKLALEDIATQFLLVVVITLVASLYPAFAASRQEPAQALRFT